MGIRPKMKRFTFDDFCVLVKDGQKGDLIDGVIYMASPDNWNANQVSVWLSWLMDGIVEELDLGKIVVSRVAFRLNKFNSPEPDIGFVKKSRLKYVRGGYFEGAPDVAVEVVSPDSIVRDFETKRELYEKAGVGEYWLIDETTAQATFLRLAKSGKFREVKTKNGVFYSQTIKGFWLRTEWLWQQPRPKKLALVQEILAGKPK